MNAKHNIANDKHRIAFDGNSGSEQWGYPLNLPISRPGLMSIGEKIHEGMAVVIVEKGEFELDATLTFVEEYGYWKAIPIEGTLKLLRED